MKAIYFVIGAVVIWAILSQVPGVPQNVQVIGALIGGIIPAAVI